MAAVYRSPQWPLLPLSAGLVASPLLAFRRTRMMFRKLARYFVRQDAFNLDVDVTGWHSYGFTWEEGFVRFKLDGESEMETPISGRGPLGLVVWIDNQYAAFPPSGRFAYGTLGGKTTTWLEIRNLSVG